MPKSHKEKKITTFSVGDKIKLFSYKDTPNEILSAGIEAEITSIQGTHAVVKTLSLKKQKTLYASIVPISNPLSQVLSITDYCPVYAYDKFSCEPF